MKINNKYNISDKVYVWDESYIINYLIVYKNWDIEYNIYNQSLQYYTVSEWQISDKRSSIWFNDNQWE